MAAILDWLNSSLKDINHVIFRDVVEIEQADKKPMGDGQMIAFSDMGRVNLTLVKANGERKHIKVIAKSEAADGAGKDLADKLESFPTEIKMYSTVLKSMENFMSRYGDSDYLWADCYYCSENKLLFEDLCESGYRIVPVHAFLDVEHALHVMEALGKFHALSFSMNAQKKLDTTMLNVPNFARKDAFMDDLYLHNIGLISKNIREQWGPEWSSVPDRLNKYFEKPGELLHTAWKTSKGKWDVLNHGDFNMRNMMFHYPSHSSHPDGIRFVDFQMCHYSNLACDLIQVLYTSLRSQVRESNIDYLLQTYVNSLHATTRRYQYNDNLPTVSDVKDCIRSLAPLIVSQILLFIPFFIMSGKKDVQKLADKLCDKYDNFDDIFNSQSESKGNGELNFIDDEDVIKVLKFELKWCIDQNIF